MSLRFVGGGNTFTTDSPGATIFNAFQQSRLAKLYGDYLNGGAPDLAQMARLSPEMASQVRGEQKQREFDSALSKLYLAPEEERPAGIAGLLGMDSKRGLEAAKVFDPRFAGNGIPSEYQVFDRLAKDANLSPEDRATAARRQLYLDPRPSNAAIQYKETTLPDGRKAWVAFDPREVGSQIIGTGETYGSGVGGTSGGGYKPGAVVGGDSGATRLNIEGLSPEVQGRIATVAAAMKSAGVDEAAIDAFVRSQLPQDRASAQAAAPAGNSAFIGPSDAQLAANRRAAEAGVDLQYQPMLEQAKADVQYGNMGRVGEMDARNAGLKAEAEGRAKTATEQAAKIGQRARDDSESLMLLKEAAGLLKTATSGGADEMLKGAGRFFGYTTEGAKADAKLNVVAGKLVGKVPRFEGPQSNIDVQLYQQMAGDLANPNKTRGERIAAAQGMIDLIKKYQNYSAQQPASGTARTVTRTGTQNGRKVVQYSDGSIEYAD